MILGCKAGFAVWCLWWLQVQECELWDHLYRCGRVWGDGQVPGETDWEGGAGVPGNWSSIVYSGPSTSEQRTLGTNRLSFVERLFSFGKNVLALWQFEFFGDTDHVLCREVVSYSEWRFYTVNLSNPAMLRISKTTSIKRAVVFCNDSRMLSQSKKIFLYL